jgi:hypothetical protein
MITELLTPLILASAPAIVEVDNTAKYDHATQITVAGVVRTTTYGATQTFDPNGRPRDNDSD